MENIRARTYGEQDEKVQHNILSGLQDGGEQERQEETSEKTKMAENFLELIKKRNI